MKYDTVIFDFDGTLVDSSEGIIKNLKLTLDTMNEPPLSEATLRKFIGPSLLISLRTHCGMNDERANEAIAVYRSTYDKDGYKLSKPYDGIIELIEKLRVAGVKTAIASAKPQYILDPCVEHLDLIPLFDAVIGSECEGRASNSKKEIVERAILGKKAVMVGDSTFDVDGGKDAGIDTIAVSYGFGFETEEEAINSNPTYVARSVEELEKILLG